MKRIALVPLAAILLAACQDATGPEADRAPWQPRLGAGSAAQAPRAYVTNSSDNTVSVIETATNTVIATVEVGDNPSYVAITPDGTHAYVTNQGGTVSVIETATNTVVATVPVGAFAIGVAVTPDGKFVYVTNSGPKTVSVIATATNTVVETIDVGPGSPVAVAITPDGAYAYVSHGFSPSKLSVISTATNTVVDAIDVGSGPWGLAITPDGAFAYVAINNAPGGVAVVSTATNTVVDKLNVGVSASHVAIAPDGGFAYVTNAVMVGSVMMIDIGPDTVGSIPLGPNAAGVAITPDGDFAYVAHAPPSGGNGTVLVISTATNTVVETIDVGRWPRGVAITPAVVTENVEIDIKPGSDRNSINCTNDRGIIPVAILTTPDFDATTVDHSTVSFAGAREVHVWRRTGEPRRHEEDADRDGDIDLVFHFRIGDTDLTCASEEATLTGETFDGLSIEGTDMVRMVGRGPPSWRRH